MNIPLREKIAAAKQRLPLPALMARRGLSGHAKKSAFCPLHENEHTKAFSVFKDARSLWHWKCHSECGGGDEITFLEKLDGLSRSEATRHFLEAAGVENDAETVRPAPRRAPRAKPSFPAMETGSDDDLARLATLRRVHPDALTIAQSVGMLRFKTLHGHRAWIITDDERLNAQARRLDGEPWEHISAKAWTLRGSWASHPIGLKVAAHYPTALLVEGGPDLLAALHFIAATRDMVSWCPVAMLGAGNRIPAEALPTFRGKRARIYPHTDPDGADAARHWSRQLKEAGASKVDCFSFAGLTKADGLPIKDVNDCTTAADGGELEGLLP